MDDGNEAVNKMRARSPIGVWFDVPMRLLTEGPLSTGSRIEVTFGAGPLTRRRLGLALTVEPNRRMAFEWFSQESRRLKRTGARLAHELPVRRRDAISRSLLSPQEHASVQALHCAPRTGPIAPR